MYSLELSINDRMVIMNKILPQRANLTTRLMCLEIAKRLSVSELEKKKINMRVDPGSKMLMWNEKGLSPLSFEFSDSEMDLLKTQYEAINKKDGVEAGMEGACKAIRDASEVEKQGDGEKESLPQPRKG